MLTILKPLTALMLGAAIFLLGNGLQTTLIPLAASLNGIPQTAIGLMGSLYFVGFAAGCWFGPRLIEGAGHVRAYAAMTAMAGAAAVLYAINADAVLWSVLRIVTGFGFAILYMVIESWLNEVADNKNRATIFAVYTFLNLTVVTAGQSAITLADPKGPDLFTLNAVLIILAAVPILLSRSAPPQSVEAPERLNFAGLFRQSPAGVMGAVAVGLANGAFWSLAPAYGLATGLDIDGIAIFMAVGVLAGAAGQLPLGRLSDKSDRRLTIAIVAACAVVTGLYLGLFAGEGLHQIIGMAAYGFFAFPLYGLSVAHVNDRIKAGGFVQAASALLLMYSAGAMIGPFAASTAMDIFGGPALFLFCAGIYGGLLVLVLLRIGIRPEVPEEDRSEFVAVPRPSPAAAILDPRSDDD